jgi:hypothetical protein
MSAIGLSRHHPAAGELIEVMPHYRATPHQMTLL